MRYIITQIVYETVIFEPNAVFAVCPWILRRHWNENFKSL